MLGGRGRDGSDAPFSWVCLGMDSVDFLASASSVSRQPCGGKSPQSRPEPSIPRGFPSTYPRGQDSMEAQQQGQHHRGRHTSYDLMKETVTCPGQILMFSPASHTPFSSPLVVTDQGIRLGTHTSLPHPVLSTGCCSCCPAGCEKCAKDCVCQGEEGAKAESEKCSCCQ